MAELVFLAIIVAFAATLLLFNALYFFIVLPRLTSGRVPLDGDIFVSFRQWRYVKAYLALLSDAERKYWYNQVIRFGIPVSLTIGLVGIFGTFFLSKTP